MQALNKECYDMIFVIVLMSMFGGFASAVAAFVAGYSFWIMLACYSGGGVLTMILVITLRLTLSGLQSTARPKVLSGRLTTGKA